MAHREIIDYYAGRLDKAPIYNIVNHFGLGRQVGEVLADMGCRNITDMCRLKPSAIARRTTAQTHRRIRLLQLYARAMGWDCA